MASYKVVQESNVNLSDKTKRVILSVIAAIAVLSVILPFIITRFETQRASVSTDTIKTFGVVKGVVIIISTLLLIPFVILTFYENWLRNRVDTIEKVLRAKKIVSVMFWIIFALFVFQVTEFLIILCYGSHRIIRNSIAHTVFCIGFGYFLLMYWKALKYFQTQPLDKILVGCLLNQCDKFIKRKKFDKAHSAIVKACETFPEEVVLQCKLAFFCERHLQNTAEADKYMAKAEELITTTRANNVSNRAIYFDYLGLINYTRGEYEKGLEFIKKAIDIELKPFRVQLYEAMLAESKKVQPGEF